MNEKKKHQVSSILYNIDELEVKLNELRAEVSKLYEELYEKGG